MHLFLPSIQEYATARLPLADKRSGDTFSRGVRERLPMVVSIISARYLVEPFDVPSNANQTPLPSNGFQASKQELSESKDMFYYPEHRLYRTFSFCIEPAPFQCLEEVLHPLDGIGPLL